MTLVRKAKHIGFCFGVKRAIDIAEKALKTNKRIYSLGPIIHNSLVVDKLSARGMKVISDIKQARGASILIRSHGIRPSIRAKIKRQSIGIIDATCPFVERSHRIVDNLKKQGFYIIIVGEKNHPEVAALAESAGEHKSIVIDKKQAERLSLRRKKVALLAQSTLTRPLFEKIASVILTKSPAELRVFDTICSDVARRQAEAVNLCRNVDLMLVVGGKISANTKRLAELCRAQGVKAYRVESDKDINKQWFKNCKSVGVVSGSSTPEWIVKEVIKHVGG